ncbi:MAG: 6-phosphofructokinase [Bacteroidetes bacterium]|nr:MAG: 6-phosphofructokinase [Bacteroidota bacterium]REK08101.1 MAG: 6-phosphofructokinase [Bacteroidota bacterium]REK32306.1 MAG: 6-phosphofructokinase [Bacteroidota bacterium]REK49540.1 MAG: 6-phosphofructokinase [Bacteroidota bacterium]
MLSKKMNKVNIKKIAVLTTGGDCPGLNAAVRAVVRSGIYYKLEVLGVVRGYEGLIDNNFIEMKSHSVSNILQRGGTVLKTARSDRFMKPEGRQKAFENISAAGVDALVVLGGDGSFRGMDVFTSEHKVRSVGIPKTIDNDIYGTDFAIGYDTAVNTVVQAIDKIRDTADSHDRLFFVEVMGRDAGMIALFGGIGSGAEAILIPETNTRIERIVEILERGWSRKKTSMIVIVAEGDDAGGAYEIARSVKQRFKQFDTRVSILGHVQRGGSPSCADRVLASRLGVSAVEALLEGRNNVMLGLIDNKLSYTSYKDVASRKKEFPSELMRIAEILSL